MARNSQGMGFKGWVVIFGLLMIICIAVLYLMSDKIKGVLSGVGSNETTDMIKDAPEGSTININQTIVNKQETTQIIKQGGTLWKILFFIAFMVIVGLIALLVISSKTKTESLKSLEYCKRVARDFIQPQYMPVGEPHVHHYRDRGDHPWYSFLFFLDSFPQNHNFNLVPEEKMAFIAVSRKDPHNERTGPRNMTFAQWEEWINDTNKNRRGAMLSPGEPYKESFEGFISERGYEAAEEELGRQIIQKQVNTGVPSD
jgi:Flp pilus assembly pilin Flp